MEWIAIMLLGFSRVSYLFWDYAMKKGDGVFLGSLSYGLPLTSTISLAFFGMGSESPYVLLAAAFIVLSCLLIGFHKFLMVKKKR